MAKNKDEQSDQQSFWKILFPKANLTEENVKNLNKLRISPEGVELIEIIDIKNSPFPSLRKNR